MALTQIQAVRVNVADLDPTMPILDDSTYEYFLVKNDFSVNRASMDAARTILLQLAMRGDETVDIFSYKGAKSAEQYRLALQLFLRDPNLNPVLTSAGGYAGGISRSDMQANNENLDNNFIVTPGMQDLTSPSNPFEV